MEQEQLDSFRRWLDEYVAGFYGDDKYINANIKLKDCHTRRTCQEMLYLAEQLGLDENKTRIAETIAIFHDIGRFRQFTEYQTYHDPRSVDHCELGLEVLRQKNVLSKLDRQETELIETAIGWHGKKQLPASMSGDRLLFCQAIRDADKLDIFYIVIDGYRKYYENPDGFLLEVELPDEPYCSSNIVESVLNGERTDYHRLRTWNDMKLCQLSWIYDVNFAATLKRIKEKKYVEAVLDFLPESEDIDKVRRKVLEYIDSAIENGIGV